MYILITLALSALFITGSVFYYKHSQKSEFSLYLKILAVAYAIIGIFRFLLSDGFVETVFDGADIYGSILRWGYYIGYAVIPMSIFFDSRLIRNIASYFSLPMAILSAVSIDRTMEYFFMAEGGGLSLVPWVRYVYYIIELTFAICLPVLMQISERHVFAVKDRLEWIRFFVTIPLMMLQMMPAYMPQSLIGYTNLPHTSFSAFHLGWIVFMVVEFMALYFFFHERSEKDKYLLIVFLTIAQFYHTNSIFLRGFTLSRLPLQLCSIAAFFYLFTILTRNKRIFGFCYIANIVGGFIAVGLAAFSTGALSFWNIHYIHEHTFVLLIPFLARALDLFPPIDRESLKSALTIFSIYFAASFILGTLINGLSTTGGYAVNFFYMFDYSRAISYVPFATFTGLLHLEFGIFEMYPILVAVVYSVFMLLLVAFYGIVYLFHEKFGKKREELCTTRYIK